MWLRITQWASIALAAVGAFMAIRKGGADAQRVKYHEKANEAHNRMADVPDLNDRTSVERLRKGGF